MAVVRKLLAHDNNQDAQWLKVDHSTRYVENHSEDWQFLFGPNSELSNSVPLIKLAAKFNENTLSNVQVIGYLYDSINAAVLNSANCVFNFYKISAPDWTETFLTSLPGSQLTNNYFYVNPDVSTFPTVNFDGGESIMVEASMVRLGITYRDRIYINHLGVYDSIVRLRNDVDFLDITKKDL
jgi:hypothetical protein